MKRNVRFCVTILAAVLGGCALLPRGAETPPENKSAGGQTVPVGSGLEAEAFGGLPDEAKVYLKRLAKAFGEGDTAFLLAQGESQFESEFRPRHDAESYLALLYRLGAYAAESPRFEGQRPRLNPGEVRQIRYLLWEEKGPLLAIQARLINKDGTASPCLIMLVWRLREPKIEGLFL
jgi:hypothetical protein